VAALSMGLVGCTSSSAGPEKADAAKSLPYPPTRVDNVVDTLHGVAVADPYRWLEDGGSPEVKTWMTDQDGFTRSQLGALPGREALTKRLRELFYVDSLTAPQHRGNRWFYERQHADKEKAIVYWREGDSPEEHVLIDPNQLSADGSTSLGTWVPSYDGKTVAYALKANNADEATISVLEVASGKVSDVDRLDGTKETEPSWTPAGDGFYYTYTPVDPKIPEADRPG
jgi:prolyl oligopeptidase